MSEEQTSTQPTAEPEQVKETFTGIYVGKEFLKKGVNATGKEWTLHRIKFKRSMEDQYPAKQMTIFNSALDKTNPVEGEVYRVMYEVKDIGDGRKSNRCFWMGAAKTEDITPSTGNSEAGQQTLNNAQPTVDNDAILVQQYFIKCKEDGTEPSINTLLQAHPTVKKLIQLFKENQ